jgi:hypothetical protein
LLSELPFIIYGFLLITKIKKTPSRPDPGYFFFTLCRFLPTPLNTQIFLYCLAVAAAKTGMIIHAVCGFF